MGQSVSTVEYPPTDMAMSTWATRVDRAARSLDIDVRCGTYHGLVQVSVEDLEALAERLSK